jgi:hypothetical protein
MWWVKLTPWAGDRRDYSYEFTIPLPLVSQLVRCGFTSGKGCIFYVQTNNSLWICLQPVNLLRGCRWAWPGVAPPTSRRRTTPAWTNVPSLLICFSIYNITCLRTQDKNFGLLILFYPAGYFRNGAQRGARVAVFVAASSPIAGTMEGVQSQLLIFFESVIGLVNWLTRELWIL